MEERISKIIMLNINLRVLLLRHVIYVSLAVDINSKRCLVDWLSIILKNKQSFLYQCRSCRDSKPILDKNVFLKPPPIRPVFVCAALY